MEMKFTDDLDPTALRNECQSYITLMETVNTEIPETIKAINDLVFDDNLTGVAYLSLKTHLLDYITVLNALKYANELDIADCKYLMENCGDEFLDGKVILTLLEVLKVSYETHLTLYLFQLGVAKTALTKAVRVAALLSAGYHCTYAENIKKLIDIQQAKKTFYEDFDGATSSFFTISAQYREIINQALGDLVTNYNETTGKYVVNLNASWRADLQDLTQNGAVYDATEALEAAGLLNEDIENMSEAELAEYIQKIGSIVSQYFPNLDLGETVEIPLGPGLTYYYTIKGALDNDSPVSASNIIEEERAILDSVAIEGTVDGLKVNYTRGSEDGSFGIGTDDVMIEIPTTFNGVTYSVDINDKYTLKTSLKAEITELTAEVSVTSNVDMGSIETAMGLKYTPRSGYATVPEYNAYTLPNFNLNLNPTVSPYTVQTVSTGTAIIVLAVCVVLLVACCA